MSSDYDRVLTVLLGLLNPEMPLAEDAQGTGAEAMASAAQLARRLESSSYSTAMTLVLADLAMRMLDERLYRFAASTAHAALRTGASDSARSHAVRQISTSGWAGQVLALTLLPSLAPEDALSIGRAIFRSAEDSAIQVQAACQLARIAVDKRLDGYPDCCEILDTGNDEPDHGVLAVHFLLAARIGDSDEALDDLLFELSLQPSTLEPDDMVNQILELYDDIRDEEVDSAIVQAQRGPDSIDQNWMLRARVRLIEHQRSTDFARFSALRLEPERYWEKLDWWLSATMDPEGHTAWQAGAAAERIIHDVGDPSIRSVAADVIGLLGERWRTVADALAFPYDLQSLCLPALDEDLLTEPALAVAVARAIGCYGWNTTWEEKLLESLDRLEDHPSPTVRAVAGASLSRLYGRTSTEAAAGPTAAPTSFAASSDSSGRWLDSLELYRWQREALDAWLAAGRRGVVEAVTGAGKTRLAIAVLAEARLRDRKAVVLVPGLELLKQWREEIDIRVRQQAGLVLRVGQLGGGRNDSLATCDVLLATMQSASKYQLGPPADGALVVVDEVHRAGASNWSLALESGFDERLGLTATFEREDLGVEEYLEPYFGGVCASVGYGEALRDGVIAAFRVAYVGVRFAPDEQLEYDEAADRAARYRTRLIADWDCPPEPFGAFMQAVHHLQASGVAQGSKLAGFYLSAFSKRRAVLSNASGKLHRLRQLSGAVQQADKTIIFTQTKQAASEAVASLAHDRIEGAVLHSGMDLDARARVFAGFEDGSHELVAAPRLLDEGIDVPAADLGIVIAASRSRRQMIQRMGRVLRRKADGRPARFVIMYVEGSSEDPAEPGHEGFLELIEPYAADVQRFGPTADGRVIREYLDPLARWR